MEEEKSKWRDGNEDTGKREINSIGKYKEKFIKNKNGEVNRCRDKVMSKWIEHFGDLLKFRGGREAKMCCLRREGVWEERGGKINATNGDKVLMALKNTIKN